MNGDIQFGTVGGVASEENRKLKLFGVGELKASNGAWWLRLAVWRAQSLMQVRAPQTGGRPAWRRVHRPTSLVHLPRQHQFVNRTPGDLQFFEWELGWQEDLNKPARLIEKVRDEHIAWFSEVDEAEDIVVLSPFGGRSSLAARVLRGQGKTPDETWLRKQLAHEGGAGRVRWFSVSKFKGLDADAVVVTDINAAARDWVESTGHSWDDVRYVAESRAKYRAVVLEGSSSPVE